jgi:hypothetical protein
VGTGHIAEFRGQSEGQQEVRAGEQALLLPLEPAGGVLAVALRAVPVATRVVAVASLAAVV